MEKNEISIAELFRSLIRHLPIILIVTIVFGVGAWAYTHFLVTPKYTASSKMIASSNMERTNDYYTSSEHNAAVALVNTTAEIIKTNSILSESSLRLSAQGMDYSVESLKKMITITPENETEVFRLTVTGTQQAEVALISNTIAEVAEERIGLITGAGGVKRLEDATTPPAPSSPSTMRNTVLGALVGFVLIALIMILRDLYDTTIWREDDLVNYYKYPVLGLVPQLDETETETKGKG